MGHFNVSADKKRAIIEARAKGYSYARIAKEVGVAKQTAVDVCKECDETVATLSALELEELYETHRVTIRERVKAHANLLNKIRAELDTRDLSYVPTDKLVDLFLKANTALKDELITPNVQTTEQQERDRKERELLEGF